MGSIDCRCASFSEGNGPQPGNRGRNCRFYVVTPSFTTRILSPQNNGRPRPELGQLDFANQTKSKGETNDKRCASKIRSRRLCGECWSWSNGINLCSERIRSGTTCPCCGRAARDSGS